MSATASLKSKRGAGSDRFHLRRVLAAFAFFGATCSVLASAGESELKKAAKGASELNARVNGEVLPENCAAPGTLSQGYRTSSLKKGGEPVGVWVRPLTEDCKTLKVFFPGQAQELGIYNSSVPPGRREEWAQTLLEGKAYHLAPTLIDAGCPVLILGESKTVLNADDLQAYLLETGATQVELIAHSAGYAGLTLLVGSLKGTPLAARVSAVKLLDNFYTPAVLPGVLTATFGEDRMRAICSGFLTDHNAVRYKSAFQRICPVVVRERDHKTPVKNFFR